MTTRFRISALVLCALASAALADDAAKPESAKPADGKTPAAKPDAAKSSDPAPKDARQEGAKSGDGKSADGKSAAAKSANAPQAAPKDAPASGDAAPAPKSLDEALRILARRRADIEFKEQPLDEVVTFIGRLGRVNTMIAPALIVKVQGALPPVTLKLRDVSLRQIAEFVAKSTGTALVLRDGVLQFTTPEDARGTPVLRVISIADLTYRIRNFPGPDIQLHTGNVRYVQEEEKDQAQPFEDPQVVVDLLKKFTGEGTWDDDEVSISADGSKLVVKQYPQVLREIARFLAVLRAAK